MSFNTNLRIVGIEVTQGIQYFNFNNQGSGAAGAPDNSNFLVQEKTTVFRVYVDCVNRDPAFPMPTTLTGTARVSNVYGVPVYQQLSPINTALVPAQPSAGINRGNPNYTVNFRLDGWQCKPTDRSRKVHLWVRVTDPNFPSSTDPRRSFGSRPETLDFDFFQPSPLVTITDFRLRVFCVRIVYTGPGISTPSLGPPSDEEMAATLSPPDSFVSKTLPVSGINYTGNIIKPFDKDLTKGGSGCGTGWGELLDMLENQRPSRSNDVVVGLLPSGTPTGVVPGCGRGGVAAAVAGNSYILAEEIGHAYGRMRLHQTPVVPLHPTLI